MHVFFLGQNFEFKNCVLELCQGFGAFRVGNYNFR